jgi:hypothetical protein
VEAKRSYLKVLHWYTSHEIKVPHWYTSHEIKVPTGTHLMKLRKTPKYYSKTSQLVKSNQDDNDCENPTEQ